MKMTNGVKKLLTLHPYLSYILPETIAQHNLGNPGEMTETDHRTGHALGVKLSQWNLTKRIKILVVTIPGCDNPQLLLPGEYNQIDAPMGDLS